MPHEVAPFRADRTPLVSPGGSELHARDMSATLAADVSLAEAQAKLAQIGQWLPVDGDPEMKLGEMIQRNTTGPLRLGYGAWRDLLLGCQFTSGRGRLITAGGRTVKNVAGLDLTKFMVGQCGILGKLVTLTTRTYLRPQRAMVAMFGPDPRIMREMLPTSARPHWAAMDRSQLYCGYLGDDRAIEFFRGAIARYGPASVEERSFDQDQAHRAALWAEAGKDCTFRASVPPMRIRQFVESAGLDQFWADAAFGIVIGVAKADRVKLIDAARELGGRITFFDPGGPTIELSPDERDLVERIRSAFDGDAESPGGVSR